MAEVEPGLKEIPCPECGARSKQVINAEKNIRKGWYCEYCKHFEKAIFRERTVVPPDGITS